MAPKTKVGHSKRKGRTAAKRLSLLDDYCQHLLETGHLPATLNIADVGFGQSPITSQELLMRLTAQYLKPRLLAFDQDSSRVQEAKASKALKGLSYHCSGFELLGVDTPPLHLIRVMNVLRGYDLADNQRAKVTLARHLAPQGFLIEGSSNTTGDILCAHIWQRKGAQDLPNIDPVTNDQRQRTSKLQSTTTKPKEVLTYIGLLLAMKEHKGFSPLSWRDHLPRDLRRHARGQEPIFLILDQLQKEFLYALKSQETAQKSRVDALKQATSTQTQELQTLTLPTNTDDFHCLWQPLKPSPRSEVFDGDCEP